MLLSAHAVCLFGPRSSACPYVYITDSSLKGYAVHRAAIFDLSKLRLPPSFTGLDTMKAWASKLNARGASDELDEGEVRQLLFDLEKTYNAFHESLSSA